MLHKRRNVQYVARKHVDYLRLIFANPESQTSIEDVGNLLILVRMPWHNRALLKINVRQHHAVARYEPPIQRLGNLLLWHVVPAIECHASLVHCCLLV